MHISQNDREFDSASRSINNFSLSKVDRVIHRRREIQYLAGGGLNGGSGNAPKRSGIVKFTPTAGKRLRRYIDNYYDDFSGMVTLTYGRDFPTDGKVVKQHLKNFFERLRRIGWLEEYSLVWWLEFQKRGAPHIHMLVTDWLSKSFVSKAWAEVSGAPLSSSTRCEALRDPDKAGDYAAKYAAKSDQKDVPDGYTDVGRFWGRRGRKPEKGSIIPKDVAAAIPGPARTYLREICVSQGYGMRSIPLEFDSIYRTRVYEHDGGWSIYGPEEEIERLWHYLQGMFATPDRTERNRDGSRRPM